MSIEKVPSTYAFICDVCEERLVDPKRWTEPDLSDVPDGWCCT